MTQQETVLGRNDFETEQLNISKKHFCVCRVPSTSKPRAAIADLSVNGTFLNGTRIRPNKFTKLQPGDIISLVKPEPGDGDVALVFRLAASEVP